MKFNFKKIASVLASAVMLTSTAGMALAANYPAPMVSGGTADGAVVVTSGDHAGAVSDFQAAVSLQSALQGQVTSGTSSNGEVKGEDFVRLDKSTNRLNMGDDMNITLGSTIDEDDMSVLLADGTYTADDNDEFDYEQKITLGSTNFTHFRDSDYEDEIGVDERTPTLGFHFSSNTFVLNYTVDFLEDAESAVSSSSLTDLEGSDIPLLGNEYYVLTAKNGSHEDYLGKMTLLDSADTATVKEGETITVDTEENSYEVSVDFIDSDSSALSVNGEITDDLAESETYKLDDGSYVGIRSVRKLETAGSTGSVEFSIGSGKVELSHGSNIKLNDDSVQGVKAHLYRGTAGTGTQKLDKIVIEWTTDDEEFITTESSLLMPGFEELEFELTDFVRSEEEKVTVDYDGDTSIELSVPIRDGTATFNILYANTTGEYVGIGKATDERLATSYNNSITYYEKRGVNGASDNYHEYMVATYQTSTDCESYLLSFAISEDNDAGRNETIITNEVTGDTTSDKATGDTVDIGDVSFTIGDIGYNSTNEWIDLNAGSNVNFNTTCTTGGLKIWLPVNASDNGPSQTALGAINFSTEGGNSATDHNFDRYTLFMKGEDKDDNKESGTIFNLTLDDNSDSQVQVTKVNNAGTGGTQGLERDDSDVYENYIEDDVAPLVLHYVESSGQDYAEVYYPTGDSESYAALYLKAADVSVGGTTTTTGEGGTIKIVTDDEVSSVSDKNLVVVGGSCINSVAAEVLGVDYPTCGSDFTTATDVGSGQYLIKAVESPYNADKVAVLVAGYEAANTVDAVGKLQEDHATDVDTEEIYPVTSA